LEIDAGSDTVSPESRKGGIHRIRFPKKGEIPFLGHNLSLPSPIERKEELSVLTKQGVKVVFRFS